MPDITIDPAFKQGDMEHDNLPAILQDGLDNYRVWTLPAVYGRAASTLIADGLCNHRTQPEVAA